MNKFFFNLFFLMTVLSGNAQTQFNPFLGAGIQFSKLNNVTSDWYKGKFIVAGVGIKFRTRYIIQPEFSYSEKGALNVRYTYVKTDSSKSYGVLTNVNESLSGQYYSFGLMNKVWLLKNKVSAFLGPSIGVLSKPQPNIDHGDVDISISIGGGCKITKNIIFEARLNTSYLQTYHDPRVNSYPLLVLPFYQRTAYVIGQFGLIYSFNVNKTKRK